MKKLMALLIALCCVFGSIGCSNTKCEVHSTREENKWDMIPMVMIDRVIYLDTGKNSGELLTSDVIDGEIISEVEGSKRPTQNDQSNFGVGYYYRYGEEGTVEILMDGKWWIFENEEARQQSLSPSNETVQFHDKTLNKSDLSKETLEWLEWYNSLSENGQLSVSFVPQDILVLCGYVTTEEAEETGPTE